MFGLSFQLPLVMVVLDRISLVPARLFREQRRWAILIIAFISMVLTPADPVSMLSMMIPLLILYEVGLVLCGRGSSARSPFEMQSA
jgi:sec-independent protein translocase protein TatC